MRYKELADAIRRGHTMAGESKHYMTLACVGRNTCCALGAAWLGSGRTEYDFWVKCDDSGVGFIARTLNIPHPIAAGINKRHCDGTSRLQIADWLDSLEEPGESDSDWAKRKVAEVTRVKEAA